jgi:CubicO group peptidase (beta-lactamase class C family)
MKIKILFIFVFFILFFIGDIAITFSYEKGEKQKYAEPGTIPLSHKLSNDIPENAAMGDFDSTFEAFMKKFEIVGASVAIAKEGRLVFSKGFGMADKEIDEPATPKSLFRIASVSKLITAVAIMKLIEDEKLSIDQKVFGSDGILDSSPYRNYKDTLYEEITVQHLLNHTAGWNSKKSDPVLNSLYVSRIMDVEPPASTPVIIEYALSRQLDFTPGEKYCYSNLGYCVLGEIVKEVTGMEYEDYVQFAILQPLGIYDMHIGKSFYDERFPFEVRYYDVDRNPLVWSYNGSGDLVPVEYGGNNIELLGAAGGWIASAPELAKLMVAVDGFNSCPDILSGLTVDYMTKTQQHTQKKLIGWRGADGHGTWWRTGTLSGTTALIMRHANETNWVVLLNTTTSKRKRIHNELSRLMFKSLYQVKEWPEYDLFHYEENYALQTEKQDD